MKCSFFQAVVSILLYGCTTWTLTKRMEKKLDGNYTRMLRAILNKKTITIRRARHAGHYWRSMGELTSDLLLWTPSHGRAKVGWPARTDIQLCVDTGCSPEDLSEAFPVEFSILVLIFFCLLFLGGIPIFSQTNLTPVIIINIISLLIYLFSSGSRWGFEDSMKRSIV